ncbi:MAG: pitrilysin family protein [Bacteroidota bacterium]
MKIPDRTIQPTVNLLEEINLPSPQLFILDNGIKVYSFSAGTQDVLKIEFVFEAGSWYQDKKLQAFSTVKMLTEGTAKHTAAELAEIFDFFGGHVETEAERDYTFVSLYSLNKNIDKLLPVFSEMIREPVFPEKELSVFLTNTRQEQMVSMQKVNYIARVKFAEQLYGAKHPYGQSPLLEDYDNISSSDLIDFYKKYFIAENTRIIISGKIPAHILKLLNTYFGDKAFKSEYKTAKVDFPIISSSIQKQFYPKENAVQSGIRIGKILFPRNHPDYIGMAILSTILGGYFGSRLMSNIREDKGYTYGIGSGLISMRHSGYLYIASEVGADVSEKAVEEIYKEIDRLCIEAVPEKELSLVKNYMTGAFLRNIDGPFAIAERFISTIDYNLDFREYYLRYLNTIKTINSEKIISLAIKYLQKKSFSEAISGK